MLFKTILVLLWSYLSVSQCLEHKRHHQDLSYQSWMKEIPLSPAAYAYRYSLIGYHPHKNTRIMNLPPFILVYARNPLIHDEILVTFTKTVING